MNTRTKNYYVVVLIIAVAAVVVAAYFVTEKYRKVPDKLQTEKESITYAEKAIRESSEGYTINIMYPQPRNSEARLAIEQYINQVKDEFMRGLLSVQKDQLYPSELSMVYNVHQSKYADTYELNTYIFQGGTHGQTDIHTFTVIDDSLVTINYVVASDQLEKLARVIKTHIRNQITKSMIQSMWLDEGLMPAYDNFERFIIHDDGIEFIFLPYQIAPYGAGIQRYTVPFEILPGAVVSSILAL
jgi:hypothetical protein